MVLTNFNAENLMTTGYEKCWIEQNWSTYYNQWDGIHLHSHSEGYQSWSIWEKHQYIGYCYTGIGLDHKLEASHLN
jgi:hypothetical protein